MRKITQIIFIFVLCSLISSCIPILENSQTAQPHFRQAWWGNGREAIKFKERKKTIHKSTIGSLVYKIQYKGVPMLLVYCFSKEMGTFRLRAAGYLTLEPKTIKDPDSVFRQELLKTLGEPTRTLADGGMVWLGEKSVVYTNAYRAGTASNEHFPDSNTSESVHSESTSDHTEKWHLITGYIDRNFYEELDENKKKGRLYAGLTYYQKIFFGLFQRIQQP